MLEWKRFSREEYEMFGNLSVWTYHDLALMLAAVETETSGVYGDSKELFPVRGSIIDDSYSKIEKIYHDNYDKWLDYIMAGIKSGKISYVNLYGKNEKIPYMDEDATNNLSIEYCCINAGDFWGYLGDDSDSGKIAFDIDDFAAFMSGEGDAPSSKVLIEKVPALPSDYHKKLAEARHDPDKAKKEKLILFLTFDLSDGCTCTKKQACDRIFKDKFGGNENNLKRDTGYKYLMFTRKVSKVLKEIEKDTKINRHENTDGFSYDKLPPTCIKHTRK